MSQPTARKIVAASFPSATGGSRAAGAIAGGLPDKIGNTAVLFVKPDGTPKFVESKDWGAGRGALLGGAIGIIAGPLGIIAGGGIGALAAKLRDSGFKNDELHQLGESLSPGSSAVVIEIAADSVALARQLLEPFGARKVVVEDIHSDVATLFQNEAAPAAELDPDATPGGAGAAS